MIVVQLGNAAPIQKRHPYRPGTYEDLGVATQSPAPGEYLALDPLTSHTTTVVLPDGLDPAQLVAEVETLWPHHSEDIPTWLLLEMPRATEAQFVLVMQMLRARLGMPPAPAGPVALVMNGGLDYAAAQLGGTASATAVANWVALTANSTAPAATDTVLTGEIATAGGGLVRAQAAWAHTTGATTYTLSKTFTANGSDVLPVTVAKVGCFTASTSGTMVAETLVSPTATFSASGDNMPLTWTFTV